MCSPGGSLIVGFLFDEVLFVQVRPEIKGLGSGSTERAKL